MIAGTGLRWLAIVLAISLSIGPGTTFAQASTETEAANTDPVETMRKHVETLLEQAREEFATVDEMLFDDPENADLLAIHADLEGSMTQLEELLAQLPVPGDDSP